MAAEHQVRIGPLPRWMPAERLLGPGEWLFASEPHGRFASAKLDRRAAADVMARLRKLGFGGQALEVAVEPAIPRPWTRAARTEDARRRRRTTPGFQREGVRLDDEGRMSLTPETLALRLAKAANAGTVVDAGCGVGGNAIAFARAGARVTAIEHDPARLAFARHNARLYGVADHIRFQRADATQALRTLQAELLFIDPPWGADWDRQCCGLSDFPLLGALLPLRGRFDRTWIKVPPSFDPATVNGAVPEACFGEAEGDLRRVKFLILRCDESDT